MKIKVHCTCSNLSLQKSPLVTHIHVTGFHFISCDLIRISYSVTICLSVSVSLCILLRFLSCTPIISHVYSCAFSVVVRMDQINRLYQNCQVTGKALMPFIQ